MLHMSSLELLLLEYEPSVAILAPALIAVLVGCCTAHSILHFNLPDWSVKVRLSQEPLPLAALGLNMAAL